MKLMVCGPFASFAVSDVCEGLIAGLRENGHEVAEYALSRRLRMVAPGLAAMAPAGERVHPELIALHASEALVYRTVVEGCRWVLVVCGAFLHPNALAALGRIGVRVAVLFTESPYETGEDGELRLVQTCDLAFTNERTSVASFQARLDRAGRGGRAHYLAHAHNPALHRPLADGEEPVREDEKSDVLLIGTGFAERQRLLEGINWDGIDLALGGTWFGIEHYGAPHRLAPAVRWPCVANRDTVRLYRGARIVLNPHRWAEGAESTNPRTYEAAACGAFQIADARAELGELVGDAVPTFPPGVPWRLEALVRRYLADDAERARLADLARARIARHTFAARAAQVVEAIEEHERASARAAA